MKTVSSKGETASHRRLKKRAKAWLASEGCRAAGTEVRLPLSAYRVDVGGYRSSGRLGVWGETFALECKQSRADFLRDASVERSCREGLAETRWEVEGLRRLLSVHLPECRQGESLFADLDTYDFSDLRHDRWRRLVARLACLERKLAEGVKFSRLARYGAANFLYLVTSAGVLLDMSEVPAGWGWLMEGESREELLLMKAAPRLASRPEAKLAFLERLAARAGK